MVIVKNFAKLSTSGLTLANVTPPEYLASALTAACHRASALSPRQKTATISDTQKDDNLHITHSAKIYCGRTAICQSTVVHTLFIEF